MPYLSGFTNDIFISYASVDNEPDAQDVRWVSRFRNDLETALRRRLGQDLAIFFDQADLHANDELEALLKNARRRRFFLHVCSPSYVVRDWTLHELKAFCETAKKRGGPNRLVTIEALPVEGGSPSAGIREPQAHAILHERQGLRHRLSADFGVSAARL